MNLQGRGVFLATLHCLFPTELAAFLRIPYGSHRRSNNAVRLVPGSITLGYIFRADRTQPVEAIRVFAPRQLQ